MEETKQCNVCHDPKPVSDFYPKKTMKSGFANECKGCSIKRSNTWKKQHGVISCEYSRKWQALNPEKHKSYLKKWNYENVVLLSDTYLIKILRAEGFSDEHITKKMIEQKREGIVLKRKIKQDKNEKQNN